MNLICKSFSKQNIRKLEKYYKTKKNLYKKPSFSSDKYIIALTAKNY